MRVIDLDDGETLQAANDEDLAKTVAAHLEQAGTPMSPDQVRELVERRAYEATDS